MNSDSFIQVQVMEVQVQNVENTFIAVGGTGSCITAWSLILNTNCQMLMADSRPVFS